MSQENAELLRRMLEVFNNGADLEGMIALADPPPEFEFVASGVFPPDLAEVYRGAEGWRRAVAAKRRRRARGTWRDACP